ncbi:uncharacterized protein LOC119076905 isoform X2 [Bradysia coprophila]|uniref:uncharacterized protein LOC119076905 isoform X2 n=1 Tax=Bradysia coprophila TaxID=38358 RepID=UPI00187DB3FD|nr:uncharacterized protein LOC119076905 isoform X2 [Bradysia coprophila]
METKPTSDSSNTSICVGSGHQSDEISSTPSEQIPFELENISNDIHGSTDPVIVNTSSVKLDTLNVVDHHFLHEFADGLKIHCPIVSEAIKYKKTKESVRYDFSSSIASDDDCLPKKHIPITNRFTQRHRYKHTYFDSDGNEVTSGSQTETADSCYDNDNNIQRAKSGDSVKTAMQLDLGVNQSTQMATRNDRDGVLPQAEPIFNRKDTTADRQPGDNIPIHGFFTLYRNKYRYFDIDGNEIELDSKAQTTSEPLPEPSHLEEKCAEKNSHERNKLALPQEDEQ